MLSFPLPGFAVVPVLVGPLQVLAALLPGLALALGTLLLSLFKPSVIKQLLVLAWRLKWQLAGLCLAIFALGYGVRTMFAAWRKPAADTAYMAGDWPLFRGQLSRLGALPGAEPARPGMAWQFKQGVEGFFASPAIVGNRLYVASAELGATSSSGRILCLNAATGELIWAGGPPNYAATFASPAIAGDYLVCGEGLHATQKARVVCLHVTPERQGQIAWTYATESHVECTPVIEGEWVYVNAGDDGVYCFHLAPQAEGEQLVWHRRGADYPDAETSLAVHAGRVYVGLGLGGKALCVLNAATGEEITRLATPCPVFGPPAIVGDQLYVGLGNGDYVYSAEEAAAKQLHKMQQAGALANELEQARLEMQPAGEVWRVDLATFQPVWKFKTDQTVLGAVAVSEQDIVCATRGGRVVRLGLDGVEQARWEARGPIIASPAVTPHFVYVVTVDGRQYALDRTTLEPRWEQRLSAQPLCISSPTVAHGHVYVGTQYNGLLCLGEPGDPESNTAPPWAGPLGGAGRGGNSDHSPLPQYGDVCWKFPVSNRSPALISVPAVTGSRAVLASTSETGDELTCFDLETSTKTRRPSVAWRTPLHAIHCAPAIANDEVAVVATRSKGASRQLITFDLTSGQEKWSRPLAAASSGVLLATNSGWIVGESSTTLAAFDQAGNALWSVPASGLAHPLAQEQNVLLVATNDPPALAALDAPTGHTLWQSPLVAAPVTGPVVAGDRVIIGTQQGVVAHALLTGQRDLAWKAPPDVPASELVLAHARVACITSQQELLVLEAATGGVRRRLPGMAPHTAPLPMARSLLAVAAEEISIVNLVDDTSEPALWINLGEHGQAACPLVLHRSQLFGLRRSGQTYELVVVAAPENQ